MTDADGIPLVVQLTAANQRDVTTLLPLVIDLPASAGKPGAPRNEGVRSWSLKAFDCESLRTILRWLGIEPVLPKRG